MARLARGAVLAAAALTVTMTAGCVSTAAAAAGCAALDYQAALTTADAALHRSPADLSGASQALAGVAGLTPGAAVALSPVTADLSASPPDIIDAQQRLDAMSVALAYPPRSTCNENGNAARGTLRDVYSAPAFRQLDAAPQQGNLLLSLLRFLQSVLGRASSALGPGGALAIILAVLGLVAWLALRRARHRADGRIARVSEDPAGIGDDPAVEWRAAEVAAAAGDHREAIRRAFRAALLDVAVRGDVHIDSAWTTRELLERCRADGDVLLAMAAAAADFDRAWYSGAPVTATDWHAAAEHCRMVRRLATRRRTVPA